MNRDEILLCTGRPPVEVAQLLADVLDATFYLDDGDPVVYREVAGGQGRPVTVGGGVSDNYLSDPSAVPDEQSIYDVGYDTIFEVWASRTAAGADLIQAEEAGRMFTRIIERLPFPVCHLTDGGLLLSAWDARLGRTDFPPGTGADEEHRDRWEPYAHPVVPELPEAGG